MTARKPTGRSLEVQNEELRASRHEAEGLRRRYAELFDFAPFGFLRLDGRGAIVESNFAGARLLGLERRRISGRAFLSFVAPRDQARFQALLAAVMASDPADPVSASGEFPLLHAEDGEVWARVTGVVLASPDAPPTALLAVEDVTARRRAEEALRAETRHKDDFLAALSHELRNPLAPIRLALSLLRRTTPGGDKAEATLSILERQTAQLSRIVDDLLDLTRISRGKIRLEAKRLELGELAQRTVEDHRVAFDARSVALRFARPEAPLWVHADGARLVQVIGNLLGNALKFTEPEGHVAVALSSEGGQAVLRVRDDGAGISPEVAKRLFVPFSQGPQGLERARGGLGLGLATARGIVELHGGAIALQSEGPGRGAEFAVRLPLVDPPARPAATGGSPPVRALRVLVIEDNADAGEMLKDLLELGGHDVRVVGDGPSGLGLAHDFRPDLVLCDLGLPLMSGYEVARALRGDETLHGALLVALSGYTQLEDAGRAGEAGFDRHVAKPASLEMLDALLVEAAAHARA